MRIACELSGSIQGSRKSYASYPRLAVRGANRCLSLCKLKHNELLVSQQDVVDALVTRGMEVLDGVHLNTVAMETHPSLNK
jgi:hypothetical protein